MNRSFEANNIVRPITSLLWSPFVTSDLAIRGRYSRSHYRKIIPFALALLCLVTLRPTAAEGLSPATSASQQSLNIPHFDGAHRFTLFSDDPRPANFTLLTAWLPGDDHKGYLQYQVTTTAYAASDDQMKVLPPSQDSQIAAYFKRMLSCSYHLQLNGGGGFTSEPLPLTFLGDVNWTNAYESLTANEVRQMDIAKYRSFLKANNGSDWKILWSCK